MYRPDPYPPVPPRYAAPPVRVPLAPWPAPTTVHPGYVFPPFDPGAPSTSKLPRAIVPLPNRMLALAGPSSDMQSPRHASTPPPPPAAAPVVGKKRVAKPKAPKRETASEADGKLLAPDYSLNPAGPASNVDTSFKCPQCDKVYQGKHARSIWRRHLQDKHGIPLSSQPRRTRWDNDANRPTNEAERKVRTLESKRKWAKKHRAEERSSSVGEGEREGSHDPAEAPAWEDDDEDGDWEDEPKQRVVPGPKELEEEDDDDDVQSEYQDEQPGRAGSAPVVVKDESNVGSRPMLRASMSMGGYVDGGGGGERVSRAPFPPYDLPGQPYAHHQAQYTSRPPTHPPSHPRFPAHPPQHAQHYATHLQQRPSEYHHAPPYYPPQHVYVDHPQAYYALPPSVSDSGLLAARTGLAHSSSLPNLASRRDDSERTYSTSSSATYEQQPTLSRPEQDVPYGYAQSEVATLYKGLLPQPYRGGATSERASSMSAHTVRGEDNQDAANVLLALKKGGSSPSSPRFSNPLGLSQAPLHYPNSAALVFPRSRSPGFGRLRTTYAPPSPVAAGAGLGVGESSLEEDDGSFAFATSSRRQVEEPSPPSSTTSDSEVRTSVALTARLPKRSASESPPLSILRESPKKARPTKAGSAIFPAYTSLVATPTPGFRVRMESSPPVELDEEARKLRDEEDEDEEEAEVPMKKVDFTRGRGGRVREVENSPSGGNKGKGRIIAERGSSPSWVPEARSSQNLSAVVSSARGRAGEMLPPHPASSSSAASFNLSTPAGPSTHDALAFRPFSSTTTLNSSGGGGPTNVRMRDDHYLHSLHLSLATAPVQLGRQAPTSRNIYGQPGSSPPSHGFLFSSPAHPGISKQLGLTAQPGPGVFIAIAGETPGKVGNGGEGKWDMTSKEDKDVARREPRLLVIGEDVSK